MRINQSTSFSGWLGNMPEAWRDGFIRGRMDTRESFANESSDMDEIARHINAARDIENGAA
jgi:hypothetical protein